MFSHMKLGRNGFPRAMDMGCQTIGGFVGGNWGGVWGVGGASSLGMQFQEMGFNPLQVTTLLGMCFYWKLEKICDLIIFEYA